MFGAALMSRTVFEEIGRDPRGAVQAGMAVLLVASVAAFVSIGDGAADIVLSLVVGIAAWILLSYGIFSLGNGVFRELGSGAKLREVLAVVGFSQAPGILLFLALIPSIGATAAFAIGLWQLWAAISATQAVFGFRKAYKSAAVVLFVWLPLQIAFALIFQALNLGSTTAAA